MKKGRWVKGEIGRAQTAWLDRMLELHPEKPAIVMAHHHPEVLGPGEKSQRDFSGLMDSGPFLELLRSRRQVKAFIFGHTHRWNVSQDPSGLHLINLPPVGYLFNLSRPNGWVQATLEPDGVGLELCALDREHPEHGERHFLRWRS